RSPRSTLFPYTTLFRSRDAARRLTEIVSREINFHGNDAHARIVGVQRREHQMEERVGVFEVAAPSVEVAMDQVKRKFLAMDGERSEEHTSELQSPDHLV